MANPTLHLRRRYCKEKKHADCITASARHCQELEGCTLGKKLGSGSFGCIYLLQGQSGKKYAMKIIKQSYHEGIHEVLMSKMLWDAFRIGARFVDAWLCNGVDQEDEHTGRKHSHLHNDSIVLVQELWDRSMKSEEFFAMTPEHPIFAQLRQLHSVGWAHNDVKDGNILVRKGAGGRQEFTLCDFGRLICFDPDLFRQSAAYRYLPVIEFGGRSFASYTHPSGCMRAHVAYSYSLTPALLDEVHEMTVEMLHDYAEFYKIRDRMQRFLDLLEEWDMEKRLYLYDFWFLASPLLLSQESRVAQQAEAALCNCLKACFIKSAESPREEDTLSILGKRKCHPQ